MSSARWVMVLGLVGASGCGGIPIISGDPFVADSAVLADVTGSTPTDLGRDASVLDQLTVEPLDVPRFEVSRPEVSVTDGPSRVEVASADALLVDDIGPACILCMRGSPLLCCGGQCRDPQTDRFNCGQCGLVCPVANECVVGLCRPPRCPPGALDCGGNCFDPLADPAHCGTCSTACAPGEACVGGRCGCPSGQTRCASGCTLLTNDVANCGACGNHCGAGQSCIADACVIPLDGGVMDVGTIDTGTIDTGTIDASTCLLGQSYCGGVCADIAFDPMNCGGCNRPCASALVCVSGTCVSPVSLDVDVFCPAGLAACNGGCFDLRSDRNHCGGCNLACPAPRTCLAGSCGADGGVE